MRKVFLLVVSFMFLAMFPSNALGFETVHRFSYNTNACGSCHSVHNAAWPLDGQSDFVICMGCHDGTTDTYNVSEGSFQASDSLDVLPTSGGLFGFERDSSTNQVTTSDTTIGVNSLSRHHVETNLIASAPGGRLFEGEDSKGTWKGTLRCETCHEPHGNGGNGRLLNPDPNGLATQIYNARVNSQVPYTLEPVDPTDYSQGFTVIDPSLGSKGRVLSGDIYQSMIQLSRVDKSNVSTPVSVDYVSFDNSNKYSVIKIHDPSLTTEDTVTGYFPFVVPVDIDVTGELTSQETVTYKSGINRFCGSCHVDYDTSQVVNSGHVLSGNYHAAYRHQVGITVDKVIPGLKFEEPEPGKHVLVCLTCHVSHGTDSDYWNRTLVGKVPGWDTTDTLEAGGSSNLKRMPNMGTCDACHHKGNAAQGSQY